MLKPPLPPIAVCSRATAPPVVVAVTTWLPGLVARFEVAPGAGRAGAVESRTAVPSHLLRYSLDRAAS